MLVHLNFSGIFTAQNLQHLMWGMQYTVLLTLTSWVLAVALGTVLAMLRAIGNPFIERIVAGYVAYHQNVPMLAQLFLWYFGFPTLLPDSAQGWINAHGGEFIFASIAIGLCMAAYYSEDIRSGLRAVSSGQLEAARSLGLSFPKSMRYVILPQGFRIAMPPFINHTVVLFKNTSLAMAIGVAELTYTVRDIENQTFQTFEIYLVGTVIYLAISLGLMGAGAAITRRTRILAK
ncbi:amino acid ABC transporter permease [Paraburkholderia fungorum]|jgi:polar amino acid transport system permease protein|uniref:Amino acid ABC transporter permease n=1 Tax=Paraburkholderia fungorum TaxID=134537 RepID=A0AAP5USG5_9BURK|nr:amino acid ABC transporter permease [Paraburkholderia fungorum]MDT8836983.1 amino acid ABC transporter permease [Paraburkholderia fungorum]PRZ54238.1 amino acid ABC transporter membrane protein 1 (PAAT family) [Paraburkholderia fungorum]